MSERELIARVKVLDARLRTVTVVLFALTAWIVFERDVERFRREFPGLELLAFRPHTPLRYWLAGGLKKWSLLPGWAFGLATLLDRGLAGISRQFCSFVDVGLRKRGGG